MKRKFRKLLPVAIIGSAVFISIAMNLLKPPPLKAESPDTALVVKTQLLHAANATLAVESQGTVLPRTQTLLTSEVSGTVLQVSPQFVVGGTFKAGDLLLQIDPTDYKVALQRAKANLISMLSIFGLIALAGVVVNDSLILVEFVNRGRGENISIDKALLGAGKKRFRAILLTTMTTFVGLLPMLFETSTQAQFVIPMALSLSFGILFATTITLVLVPCLYRVIYDLRDSKRFPVATTQKALS